LSLLAQRGDAKLLSEPTLVTFSGKEASFLVGEERPIIQQLQNTFTVEFKEVGVRMKVKPVADSQNRINTTIHAEVSQVTGTIGSFAIPVISSRKVETTLQVNDGQTIVLSGLLDNNISKDTLRKVPWLGDIPVIGALFRHKDYEKTQKEIAFFMTPEIVKDVDATTAGAVQTPRLKQWNDKGANENLLPVPSPREDWGLHNLNGLGLPEIKAKTTVEPAGK
jgi:pilus assembly protein CpaC